MDSSFLMCDSTEGDGRAEIVMDYVMSWSLRHAEDRYKTKELSVLSNYCRYMLGVLLDIQIEENTYVESVKVWKEWQYIDLCVEAVIKQGDVTNRYALLIENKYYSKLHDNQLQRYQKIFDAYYDEKNKNIKGKGNKWKLRHKLVTCCDRKQQLEELYAEGLKNSYFKGLTFYRLLSPTYWDKQQKKYVDSESEIFNEFWLRSW